MKIIGLTGAPGCGKSTVLSLFKRLNWNTVDADEICAEIHKEPADSSVHLRLKERWGGAILNPDGSTNKKVLAERVFSDRDELDWLESILLPEIKMRILAEAGRSGERPVMVEAALLFENEWETFTRETVAVWSNRNVRMKRLLERGWSPEQISARCTRQFSADKKLELAGYGLINNSTMDSLAEQCSALSRRLRNIF